MLPVQKCIYELLLGVQPEIDLNLRINFCIAGYGRIVFKRPRMHQRPLDSAPVLNAVEPFITHLRAFCMADASVALRKGPRLLWLRRR